ncbi:MAG: substrate-binding domain-containing protein [Caldilineaceae bacterium]
MQGKQFSRRHFLQLAGGAAAFTGLAACVAPTAQNGGGTAAAASSELKIWVFPLTENDQEWLWNPLTEKFNEVYPDVTMNVELLPWGGRREKMMTAFAAGEAPNIAYVNTDTISLFGTRDVLVPLDDFISAEDWVDFPSTMTAGISWDGKRIMIPTLFIVTGHVANKAMLEELGLDPANPPYTWDDLQAAGALAKEKDYFLTDWNTTNWGAFVQSVWQAGGTLLNEDATDSLLDSEPGIAATTFIADLFKNEWVPREGAVGTEEEGSALAMNYFFQQQQLIVEGNPTIVDQVSRQAPDIELVLVPTWQDKTQVQQVGSGCWGLFKNTASQEAAVDWVKFMIEPENQGFYCSVTGFAPPRKAALAHWKVDPMVSAFVELHVPYAQLNQDTNFHWQLQKVIWAPHFQAAVLGVQSVEDAVRDADAEITAAIQEELAKQQG